MVDCASCSQSFNDEISKMNFPAPEYHEEFTINSIGLLQIVIAERKRLLIFRVVNRSVDIAS